MTDKKNTPEVELDEIKTILQQLQSMSVPGGDHDSAADQNQSSTHKTAKQSFKPENVGKNNANGWPKEHTVYISIIILMAVGLIYLLYDNWKTEKAPKPKTQIVKQTNIYSSSLSSTKIELHKSFRYTVPYSSKSNPFTSNKRILSAEDLMKKGLVHEARTALINESQRTFPRSYTYIDITFLIAQSYDPNYLAGLKFSNAEADLAEAEKWYRKWHKVALQKGIVSNDRDLNSILQTLQ